MFRFFGLLLMDCFKVIFFSVIMLNFVFYPLVIRLLVLGDLITYASIGDLTVVFSFSDTFTYL